MFPQKELRIEAFNVSELDAKKDTIGSGIILLKDIQNSHSSTFRVPLYYFNKNNIRVVQEGCIVFHGIITSDVVSRFDGSSKAFSIQITEVSATNLPVTNRKTSDPYIVIKKDGGEHTIYRTEPQIKTLNPCWREVKDLILYTLKKSGMIQFHIFDHNDYVNDVFLGFVNLELSDLLDSPTGTQEFKILVNSQCFKNTGTEATLKITWKIASMDPIKAFQKVI